MLKKFFKIISKILISAVIALMIYAAFTTTFLKKSYVNVFGHTFFVVASGSMSGSVNVNDLVIVKITKSFNVDDIVTYEKENYFVTHRVVSKTKNEVILKGDVNEVNDDPVSANKVIGKVIKVIPFKSLFQLLTTITLVAIVLVTFNFDKLFKRKVLKNEIEGYVKPSKSVINEDELKDSADSEVIKEIIALLENRSGIYFRPGMVDWYRNLKFATKLADLIRINDVSEISKLLIKLGDLKEKITILSPKLELDLKNIKLETYSVLILNCIVHEDKEIFDEICIKLKEKIEN